MDWIAAVLSIASFLATALAIALPPAKPADATPPRLPRVAIAILWVTALFCVAHGLLGPAERELVCTHTFVGYEGVSLELSAVEHPTETTHAAGWLWPLPFVAFAALWSLLILVRDRLARPFVLPLLLGWSATALWLIWQKLAAPAAVVQPVGLERFLWPAGLALALRLARTGEGLVAVILRLSIGVVALRLPAALFSKIASDAGLGTSLDVSRIVDFVHPITRMRFSPPLEPGSADQQFWLIWAEHVLAFPAFHMLSLAGIAFCAVMLQKHASMTD